MVGGYAADEALREMAPAAGNSVIKREWRLARKWPARQSGFPEKGLAVQKANHASYTDVASLWPSARGTQPR